MEVQNENRAMEESMSEMEKELVATKMKWAEVRYFLQYSREAKANKLKTDFREP
jgi:hypothetical protein